MQYTKHKSLLLGGHFIHYHQALLICTTHVMNIQCQNI